VTLARGEKVLKKTYKLSKLTEVQSAPDKPFGSHAMGCVSISQSISSIEQSRVLCEVDPVIHLSAAAAALARSQIGSKVMR
jgi:hypothetical protein